ncbi:MAG: flagellar motor protein MotB, partial [Pseudomonadales bacterium]
MSADDEECICPEPEPGIPGWMPTFADLMSLLMCFFVLLLSFSEMGREKVIQNLQDSRQMDKLDFLRIRECFLVIFYCQSFNSKVFRSNVSIRQLFG